MLMTNHARAMYTWHRKVRLPLTYDCTTQGRVQRGQLKQLTVTTLYHMLMLRFGFTLSYRRLTCCSSLAQTLS